MSTDSKEASAAPGAPSAQEQTPCARFTWNAWPASQAEARRTLLAPLAVVHTPLRTSPSTQRLYLEPLVCPGSPCAALFNPFCEVDSEGKWWTCAVCGRRNVTSGSASSLSRAAGERRAGAAEYTVEYALPRLPVQSAVLALVVNTALSATELYALRDSLSRAVSLLPANTRVALVTFGANVFVHDLRSENGAAYAFDGTCMYGAHRARELLGLPASASRFVVPLRECEFALSAKLDELAADPDPPAGRRPLNATGVAASVVAGLLDGTCRGLGARAMFFLGTPCTSGPGMVVGTDILEMPRSHHTLLERTARHSDAAAAYYEDLATTFAGAGHAVDLFCCSLDQVGLHEMRSLCEKTGGVSVLSDSFSGDVFGPSLLSLLEKDYRGLLRMGFRATIEVLCSRDLKVCGAMGHVTTLEKATPWVSDNAVGIGGTSAWQACTLDQTSSLTFFLESAGDSQGAQPRNSVVQILTHYYNNCGQAVLRVTTLSRPAVVDPTAVSQSFDQDAAAAVVARQAVERATAEGETSAVRWLDRQLVRLLARHASFRRGDAGSFSLSGPFAMYPLSMFHLRRGPLISVFNTSPDETAFYRMSLARSDVPSALSMLRPSLWRYDLPNASDEGSASATRRQVALVVDSVSNDSILLLDAFFFVVVMVGHSLALRRRRGEVDEKLAALFARAAEDSRSLATGRFPKPSIIECSQYSSDSRFLMCALDPSDASTTPTAELITEDVSYSIFRDHVVKQVFTQ